MQNKKYRVKLSAYKIGAYKNGKPLWQDYATLYATDREDAKEKIVCHINRSYPFDTTVIADMRTVRLVETQHTTIVK